MQNIEIEIQNVKSFINKLPKLEILNVGGNRESNAGFEGFSKMVYNIVFESLKPIYIPPEVIDLIIQSCIINTNPFLIKSTLNTFCQVSKDWYDIANDYLDNLEVNCLRFAKDSYLHLNYVGEKLTNNYTVEFWLKKEEFDKSYPSMSILNDPFCAFKLEQFSNKMTVGFTKYHSYDKSFKTQLKSKWTHIAFSCSKSEVLSLYINGELKETMKQKNLSFHCPIGWIGGEGNQNGGANLDDLIYGFKGDILEFKVWNVERTGKEILNEMYHVYPKHKNLQFYMMFADGQIYDYCSKNEMKNYKNIEEIKLKLKDF